MRLHFGVPLPSSLSEVADVLRAQSARNFRDGTKDSASALPTLPSPRALFGPLKAADARERHQQTPQDAPAAAALAPLF